MAETEKNLQSLDHIPIDVLFEILVKLPAKSVARFLCVSKVWATMIRGEVFIRSFTSYSSPQKQPRLLFALVDCLRLYNKMLYFFSKSTHVSTPILPWDPAPGPPVKPHRFGLFWRASAFTSFTTVLVRFDVRAESLEVASKFPEGLKSSNGITLINYHGKVAVVSKNYHNDHHDFNLWVLEDTKKQQWSNVLVSFHTGVTGQFHGGLEVLGTSDMGEIVFAPNHFEEFVVYFLDQKSNRIRSVLL
ncbi:hypothetical protein AXX17_AT1G41860 [Arabidopsis thaliana]|uniref:F-box domain-containing protein n=1 Tax=Arabidopsis thaliana TaxID=3702 RepID=A0A178WII7_ARATH|nr:hypothetical protein AXX17_AT1G41860 [Arabidopsis thaliana]